MDPLEYSLPPLQLTLPFEAPPPLVEPPSQVSPLLPQQVWASLSVEQQTHVQQMLTRIFQEVLNECQH